jgi:hypothetical protein
MQHQRAARRAVLKSIAGGAMGLFAVSFRAHSLRAQSAPADTATKLPFLAARPIASLGAAEDTRRPWVILGSEERQSLDIQ